MFNGSLNIFKKLTDNIHLYDGNQSTLTNDQLQNLKELESNFNGSVNIVVTDAADGAGPFTIPGVSEILTTGKLLRVLEAKNVEVGLDSKFTQIRFTFQRFYDFFKEGVTIDRSGDSFNVKTAFNEPITVYVPPWFLDNSPTLQGRSGRTAEIDITDNTRVGIILHEIGHWTNNSMLFESISFILRILGLFLFIFSLFKMTQINRFENNNKFIQKIKDVSIEKINKTRTLVFYAITAMIGFIIYKFNALSNLFTSFNESNADNISKSFGYGQDVSEYVTAIMTKLGGESYSGPLTSNLKNFEVLFKEFFTRLNSNYPSLEWRTGNLLGLLESDTNLELFIENEVEKSSKLSNIITLMLIQFDKLVLTLPSLKNRGNIRSVSNKTYINNNSKINENINLLLAETTV